MKMKSFLSRQPLCVHKTLIRAFLLQLGAPRVVSSPNQYGLEGKQITLECIVQSIPKAKVVWRRNNQSIEAENQYGVELSVEPKLRDADPMVRHLLKIHNAKLIDFGQYNCTATNELGEHSILISLTRQSKCALFSILVSRFYF